MLNAAAPQLLLPDGRLWHHYTRRGPEGIYYDAAIDHDRSMHGSIPLGGARFSYLGAVIGTYSFGYRHEAEDDSDEFELGAIEAKASSAHFVHVADALADITNGL